jgi:sugar phosphate isomerase/epimerase
MTELGVFARVFPTGSPTQVAGAIRRAGFVVTQLNLSALGRPTLDTRLSAEDARVISRAFTGAGVRVWGVSGTFNAIHPDHDVRRAGIAGCLGVIERARDLGAEVVTLCTGTRDAQHMWESHPDNAGADAWADLRQTLDVLIPAAAAARVRLGVEPEAGNVIGDAPTAARLLDELGPDADHVAIVLDPANLVAPSALADQAAILESAFALLGRHTAAVHAKDVTADGYVAAGLGALDYALILRLHAALPHAVPVIAQDLEAADAPRVHAFLSAQAGRVDQ